MAAAIWAIPAAINIAQWGYSAWTQNEAAKQQEEYAKKQEEYAKQQDRFTYEQNEREQGYAEDRYGNKVTKVENQLQGNLTNSFFATREIQLNRQSTLLQSNIEKEDIGGTLANQQALSGTRGGSASDVRENALVNADKDIADMDRSFDNSLAMQQADRIAAQAAAEIELAGLEDEYDATIAELEAENDYLRDLWGWSEVDLDPINGVDPVETEDYMEMHGAEKLFDLTGSQLKELASKMPENERQLLIDFYTHMSALRDTPGFGDDIVSHAPGGGGEIGGIPLRNKSYREQMAALDEIMKKWGVAT